MVIKYARFHKEAFEEIAQPQLKGKFEQCSLVSIIERSECRKLVSLRVIKETVGVF